MRMTIEAPPVAPAAAPCVVNLRERLEACHVDAWNWALACCRGEPNAAHDVLHDAYVAILGARATFAGRSSFKTWLFGVVRVSAMAARRRRLVRDFLFEPISARAEAIAAPLAPTQESRRLGQAIAALPERQREIVALVFAHDLTIEEAAQVMKISLGAARQHHARAKAKLRAALTTHEKHHG